MKTAQLNQKRINVLVLHLITVQAVRQNQFLFKTRYSSVISKLAQHINIQIPSKRLWFVDTVLWLCPSLPTETLKWLSSLPIFMQESFWWWQCSDRYILSVSPHIHTPFPPSLIRHMVSVDDKHLVYLLTHPYSLPPLDPSLISLIVSVDVKHHVYLLTF